MLVTGSILKQRYKFIFLKKNNTLTKGLGGKKNPKSFWKTIMMILFFWLGLARLSLNRVENGKLKDSYHYCLTDEALSGIMELVQSVGLSLTQDCVALKFIFFISQSLLS